MESPERLVPRLVSRLSTAAEMFLEEIHRGIFLVFSRVNVDVLTQLEVIKNQKKTKTTPLELGEEQDMNIFNKSMWVVFCYSKEFKPIFGLKFLIVLINNF